MMKFQPKDTIAGLSLILITLLKLKGFDGYLDGAIALIIGYYFAHRKDGTDTGV